MKGEWYAVIGLGLMLFVGFPLVAFVFLRTSARDKQNRGNQTRANLFEILCLFVAAAVTLPVLIWIMVGGRFWAFEVPIKLAVGWVAYLARVVRQIEPDAMHVVSAAVCTAATAVAAHRALRWGAASAGCAWSLKRTFQVLVLVALMFASGLAVAGVVQQATWLLRTPEPLVKDSNRIS